MVVVDGYGASILLGNNHLGFTTCNQYSFTAFNHLAISIPTTLAPLAPITTTLAFFLAYNIRPFRVITNKIVTSLDGAPPPPPPPPPPQTKSSTHITKRLEYIYDTKITTMSNTMPTLATKVIVKSGRKKQQQNNISNTHMIAKLSGLLNRGRTMMIKLHCCSYICH